MKKIKILMAIIGLLLLVAVSGCDQISGLTGGTSSDTPDIVRGADIGEEWRMDQMLVNVGPEAEALVLLRLDYDDKVDGYFYLEKGSNIEFQITGNSLVYEASDDNDSSLTSDRFTFRANQEQGNTYTLTFYNPETGSQNKAAVFLEVIYPTGGSLFMPIERE